MQNQLKNKINNNNSKKMIKRVNFKEAGITLVALVVTIIIILILAGITLSFLFGQNGLLMRTQTAYEESRAGSVQELRDLWFADVETDQLVGTHIAKSVAEIADDIYSRNLINEDEKQQILELGKVTIGSREIIFEDVSTPRGDGTLSEGSGTEQDPILIQSIEDLETLAENVSPMYNGTKSGWSPNTYSGKYFKLVVNLDFQSRNSYIDPDRTDFGDVNGDGTTKTLIEELNTGYGYKGIGYYNNGYNDCPFEGNIDGNYKKIKNLYMQYYHFGFIGFLGGDDVTLKNLTLENLILGKSDLSNTNEGGLICVSSARKVTIENCHLSGNVQTGGSGCNVGGFVGFWNGTYLDFLNCDNSANVYGYDSVSGYIGKGRGLAVTITNCTYSGNVFHQEYGGACAGGFLGRFEGDTVEISNSRSINGSIRAGYDGSCGGIVGRIESASTLRIVDCYNTSNIMSRVRGAGILGDFSGANLTIQNCYNTGNVVLDNSSYCYTNGGIVGVINGCNNLQISDCYNEGTVSACWDCGGIIGSSSASGTISRCYSKGAIIYPSENTSSVFYGMGGIVGKGNGATITDCVNLGTLSCNKCDEVGGIVGDYSGVVQNCYNLGQVVGKNRVGGIIGKCNGIISKCYCNTTYVVGSAYVGGICGKVESALVEYSYNLTPIARYNNSTATTYGSIVGKFAGGLQNNAYLASTFERGRGNESDEDPYEDSDQTCKRVDDASDLYAIMQTNLTGDNWELKAGEDIPTLKIMIN